MKKTTNGHLIDLFLWARRMKYGLVHYQLWALDSFFIGYFLQVDNVADK